ncbi:hypothetical protein Sru01_27200 [Sphaerisporangium rufum]|uniref:Acyl-CoA thioesterase-like C-terminal domain-containing protein n=1 Tax=Sphaerisporangium rufum TaxID=1381558 RepID=A0A919R2A2_9ACTN|nr:thioesterase family protein [Sphaerisporangium rufum]GII77738.1 hypothetical protein Sru01_27200 [Sphaerisporangium rufum]
MTLSQQGRLRMEALITLGRLDDAGPWWSRAAPVELPPEPECLLAPPEAPGGIAVPLMGVLEVRIHPGHLGFGLGDGRRDGVIGSWQRLADGSDWDPVSLLVALYAVPPVTYNLDLPGWMPTIQLSAYIRRLPAPGPLRVRLAATDVGGDRIDQSAQVWDAKDRLIAQSTQLAAVRVPAA